MPGHLTEVGPAMLSTGGPVSNLSWPLQGTGPARGHVVELDPMLDEYHGIVGRDKDGVPTPERLQELEFESLQK